MNMMDQTWKLSVTLTRETEAAPTLCKEILFDHAFLKMIRGIKNALCATGSLVRMLFGSGRRPEHNLNRAAWDLQLRQSTQRYDR